MNLLGNAFKFTLEGNISIVVTQSFINTIMISVVDTGIGIRDQDKPRLIRAFGKIIEKEGKKLNAQGVGLGLFISN